MARVRLSLRYHGGLFISTLFPRRRRYDVASVGWS
jgi:hypothetical protein